MTEAFFDYELPEKLIAQDPAPRRDQSRLLVLRRHGPSLEDHIFRDLPKLLAPGDLLVLNDTRVMPARLLGKRQCTGGNWEGLFLTRYSNDLWELLCRTRGRLVAGETIAIDPGNLTLILIKKTPDGHWLARPDPQSANGAIEKFLDLYGQIPLPPYIRKGRAKESDRDRYQTVYARAPGAVAAPTAGLHFTPELFDQLQARDIQRAFVTLHVGLGTFQPLSPGDYRNTSLHREWGELSSETATAINECMARRGRVVAVGTTSVRVLETVAAQGPIKPWSGQTNLFIFPPYDFRVVGGLITNFHLPRSSLLLLVSAFAGSELTGHAYRTAIAADYRFFSYGDAMIIL